MQHTFFIIGQCCKSATTEKSKVKRKRRVADSDTNNTQKKKKHQQTEQDKQDTIMKHVYERREQIITIARAVTFVKEKPNVPFLFCSRLTTKKDSR